VGGPRVGRYRVLAAACVAARLRRGRAFTTDDREGKPRVAIINETAAQRLWPGEDPVGKRFWIAAYGDSLPADQAISVVGGREMLYRKETPLRRYRMANSVVVYTQPG
jgi:hypothetical protein